MKKSERLYQFFQVSNELKLNDLSFETLKENIQNAINKKEFATANRYAAKAASEFGAAGLLLKYHSDIQVIKHELANGEQAQATGFNTLVVLHMTSLLCQRDPNELIDLQKLMPELDSKAIGFWEQKISGLVELAALDNLNREAEQAAIEAMAILMPKSGVASYLTEG